MTEPVRRDDYTPPAFLVDSADLILDLDAAATRVTATLSLRRNPDTTDRAAPLRLDGEDLALESVALDGEPLTGDAFIQSAAGLVITDVPDRFELSTTVVIRPDRNTELMGLYCAGGMLCTQCEPEAFRRITFFPDRPDVLAVFTTTLIADTRRYPVLLGNGNSMEHEDLPNGRHRAVWHNPHPMPSYLFALVAGELESRSGRFETASGREVTVNIYVEPGNRDRCAHALQTIGRAMAWDETRYGREYDLDVFNAVAVSAYTMGAMENKGLNIFNDRYVLADPETATDRDYRDIEALVAHEYLHNWSGNRVTCRDWFQLALKEGFTVFREQQFVADQGWGEVRRLEDVAIMRTRQFAEDAGPLAHPVRPSAYRRIDNFYTDTVYSKGAEFIRMLALLIGERTFRRGTDRFFERHDGGAAVVEDFLACMEAVSGRDLSQFAHWYDRAGTPTLEITLEHDPESASATLSVRQSGAPHTDKPLHMPLALAFLDREGRRLPLRLEDEAAPAADVRVLELCHSTQVFRFQGMDEPPVPSLLRGFSAPVHIHYDYTEAELVTVAGLDDDACVRRDAILRLTARHIRAAVSGEPDAPESLLEAFSAILAQAGDDPGLAASLMTLPGERALTLLERQPDYEAIHRARQALQRKLGERLIDGWQTIIQPPGSGVAGPPTVRQAGSRRLSDVGLEYWFATGDADALAHCRRQWREAAGMSERLAALALLADSDAPDAEDRLADFRRHWAHEPLVMDQWLALQARAAHGDALARVRRLMQDPVFSLDQPNRVRALVETFCTENLHHFHRPDGAGYCLLADCVLAIDRENPPLAAGLLRNLVDWRRQTPGRAERMRAELTRVAEAPELSEMSAEIAAAGLAG